MRPYSRDEKDLRKRVEDVDFVAKSTIAKLWPVNYCLSFRASYAALISKKVLSENRWEGVSPRTSLHDAPNRQTLPLVLFGRLLPTSSGQVQHRLFL